MPNTSSSKEVSSESNCDDAIALTRMLQDAQIAKAHTNYLASELMLQKGERYVGLDERMLAAFLEEYKRIHIDVEGERRHQKEVEAYLGLQRTSLELAAQYHTPAADGGQGGEQSDDSDDEIPDLMDPDEEDVVNVRSEDICAA